MIHNFRSEKESLLKLEGLLRELGRELGTSFRSNLFREEDGKCRLEIEENFWGNCLEPVIDFLGSVEHIQPAEDDGRRFEVIACGLTFAELRQKYMRAAGPLWIRMGMCRVVDRQGEKSLAMDLAGSSYLRIMAELVHLKRTLAEAETKGEKNKQGSALACEPSAEPVAQEA